MEEENVCGVCGSLLCDECGGCPSIPGVSGGCWCNKVNDESE